jgi:hypothetical protein
MSDSPGGQDVERRVPPVEEGSARSGYGEDGTRAAETHVAGLTPVSYPPAMYAAEILSSRTFAAALGYAWLHDEDTPFVRAFREQVGRQAELYRQWLEREE